MDSRQRVLDALEHRKPDRVPVDFGGHRSSAINGMAYARLKKALGIDTGHVYMYDMVQQLAIVEPDVLDALGVDTIELGRAFMIDASQWKDWELPDGTPCKIPGFINLEKEGGHWYMLADDGRRLGLQKEGSVFFEQTWFPLMERGIEGDDFSDIEVHLSDTMWTGVPAVGGHIPLNEEGMAELAKGAKALRESTDRAIIGLFGGNMFEVPQWLYRMDNYFMYMALYPDDIVRLSEKLCDIYIKNLEKWLGAVGEYIDVILLGDDLGGKNGPLLSTDMYRLYYKPYHKNLAHRAKELADVKVMIHTCGGMEPLIEDLIEAGIDAINPVQISCRGMDPKELKAKYGDRMCFWGGGCDTGEVLPKATPEEVEEHVKELVKVLGPGGGFVFQQVHNIMSEVPPENIIAMFRAVNP